MRREPSLTLRGALEILGHHEPRVIDKLDKLLGGVILAAGVGAGLAVVGGPAVASLGAFAALWGWVDQKNEAVVLLRQAIDAISGKLMDTAGFERRQLIAAAHTTIVIAGFFESFRERVGSGFFERLQITEAEKDRLISGRDRTPGESLFDLLYVTEVSAPTPARGYEENVALVQSWMGAFAQNLADFLSGLAASKGVTFLWGEIIAGAVERYRSNYLAIAATVPEFMVWAMLGEHAATRSGISGLRSDIEAALGASRAALGRVESLLAVQPTASGEGPDLCSVVGRANRGVLQQPIVPVDAERYGSAVVFPPVGQIYINPRFRIAGADAKARPADEKWWEEQPPRDDLDITLAAHVTAPDSTRLPLLLMGHPGSGKSMLTKVFAARLPASAYTVVRVPLRRVGANAPIHEQIQQALDLATHQRVNWWRLVEQSRGTVRVVLLDGLDELLQATSNDRSGYLQDVMEFQRIEAEQERPVVVVVTSRTVVADRVDIPEGTTVVKLDYFDETDIEEWLHHWSEANASSIASGTVRELTMAAARQQSELARQPLLLLMLALYSADPAFPALDADLSTADLYQRLLDNFARREVAKKASRRLSPDEVNRRVRDQLERLSIAALAMFNRGRQDITETELGADLAALDGNPLELARLAELGQRLIGEFFFVHAAEAQPLSALKQADGASALAATLRREPTRRSYEFLHATFGEYLVASRVVNELIDVALTARDGRRGPREPDDELLFALLSHQPLIVRPSIVRFAIEGCASLTYMDRGRVLEVLEILIGSYRCRHGSDRYTAYRPLPLDRIRQLAAYSANLVVLRVALEPDSGEVSLARMLREPDDAMRQWRSTVTLWRSGLDADGQQAMMGALRLSGNSLLFGSADFVTMATHAEHDDVLFAQLVGDAWLRDRLRFGMAIRDDSFYISGVQDSWADMMASWLIPNIAGVSGSWLIIEPSPDITQKSAVNVAALLMRLIKSPGLKRKSTISFLKLLFSLPQVFEFDTHALVAAVIREPGLVAEVPELRDPSLYGEAYGLLRMLGTDLLLQFPEISPESNDILGGWWNTLDPVANPLDKEIKALVNYLLNIYAGKMRVETIRLFSPTD